MMWLVWLLHDVGALLVCAFIAVYFKQPLWMFLALLFTSSVSREKKEGSDNGDGSNE